MKSKRMTKKAKTATVRSLVESFGPLSQQLLEIERCARSIDAMFAGIPSSVRKGDGPEDLLETVQTRLDRRFADVLGLRGTRPATQDAVREILDRVRQLAEASGADPDVTLPIEAEFDVWTGDENHYSEIESNNAARSNTRLKFDPVRRIKLADDGSLLTKSKKR